MAADALGSTAGKFAEERFRARRRAWWRRIWWTFPLLAGFEVAACVGLGALVQPKHLAFYWGFGLGMAAAMVVVLADSPPHHIERWRQGAQGEKATAKQLRRLVKAGWILVNDIETGRANIDHILVGPAGVFVLETKQLHGALTVERGVLSVRWREDPADGYENRRLASRMHAMQRRLEARLATDGIADVRVQPVVVLWGRFEQSSVLSRGVAWIAGKRLAAKLGARPSELSHEQVARVATSVRRPWREA